MTAIKRYTAAIITISLAILCLPAFLNAGVGDEFYAPPVFVARETELAWLDMQLTKTFAGQSRVAFISGGPGRGKTALMEAFAREAMRTLRSRPRTWSRLSFRPTDAL